MSEMFDDTPPSPECSNPFASRYVRAGESAYRDPNTLEPLSASDLIDRLKQVRFGTIEGEHGTGKSTLLHWMAADLEADFPGGRWVLLNRSVLNRSALDGDVGLDGDAGIGWIARLREIAQNGLATLQAFAQVASGGVLVVDGAEQLPPGVAAWLKLAARHHGRACLMTSHSPIRGFTCLHRTSWNPCLVRLMFDDLIQPMTDAKLQSQVRKHFETLDLSQFPNVRDLWSHLYDWVETNRTSQ